MTSFLAEQLRAVLETKSAGRERGVIHGGNVMPDGLPFVLPPDSAMARRWLQAQLARARREGLFAVTVCVTPALAAVILENNPGNRPHSKIKLADYKRDMLNGAWSLNGETIIIADTGELNDGQHRLTACRNSGASFHTQMVFGAARDSRTTVDTGLKRTVGAILAMGGRQHANELANAVKLIIIYERHQTMAHRPDWVPTVAETQAWIEANDDLAEHLKGDARGVARKFRLSGGLLAALHYLTLRRDRVSADIFWSRLLHGNNLARNDPINRLRDRLIDIANAKGRLPPHEIAAIIIKAWNLHRRGKPVGRALVWKSGGENPEPFPMVE